MSEEEAKIDVNEIIVPFKVSELQQVVDELAKIEYVRVAGIIDLLKQRSAQAIQRMAPTPPAVVPTEDQAEAS